MGKIEYRNTLILVYSDMSVWEGNSSVLQNDELSRIEPLKEVDSRLRKLVTKTRITVEEKKEEEEIRSSSKIEVIQNPRESIKLAMM